MVKHLKPVETKVTEKEQKINDLKFRVRQAEQRNDLIEAAKLSLRIIDIQKGLE